MLKKNLRCLRQVPRPQHGIPWFVVLLIAMMGFPAMTPGENYTLEYGDVCAGGGTCESANYQVADQIALSGTADTVQSSASYTVDPLTAATDSNTSVEDWMLY